MKRVLGISVGSSARDHTTHVRLLDERIRIQRRGTDGDFARARALFERYDGKVDAFGLGGIDLSLGIREYRYDVKDAVTLVQGLRTPVFDGNGLKHVLDPWALRYLQRHERLRYSGKKVFMVCASNRSGMAEEFERAGCRMTYGDFMFALKLPIPVRSLAAGELLARMVLPIATRLPHRFLYPIGRSQEVRHPRFERHFQDVDIIAGDFHYIRRYAPDRLDSKTIITTTTTRNDIAMLRRMGVASVATTTPELDGRAFGSNIMEAAFSTITPDRSQESLRSLLRRLQMRPAVHRFG